MSWRKFDVFVYYFLGAMFGVAAIYDLINVGVGDRFAFSIIFLALGDLASERKP